MKIALVYANQFELLSPQPIGLSLLTIPLKEAGHDVHLIDLMKEKNPDAYLLSELERYQPDMVGFSLRNLDNQNYRESLNFVPDYKRWVAIANNIAPTIIGGSALMSIPEEMFNHLNATFGLVGQADKAFVTFLKEYEENRTTFQAPGLMWKNTNGIHQNPGRFDGYSDGGTIDWESIDATRYKKRYMNDCVITKTGCPYKCIFCDAGASFGKQFKPREPQAIIDDLHRDAREYGYHKSDYFFIDAMFNEPVAWAKELLEALIKMEFKINFSAVLEPTATIDRELVRLLRRAGCSVVTFLLNSLDDDILSGMKRPFNVDSVNHAIHLFHEEKIPYMPQFLLGGPGETRETIIATLSQLKSWKPIMMDAGYGLRILPKAGLASIAKNEGVIDEDTDLLKPTFYLSEPLKKDTTWLNQQMKQFKQFRMSAIPQWVRMLSHGIRVGFQK